VCYPEEILPRAKVYRHNVIEADQWCRLKWLGILAGVFLVFGCISLNATSLHGFYRDRLAATFIEPIENDDRTIRLSKLNTATYGVPYVLFSATLNRTPDDRDPSMMTHQPSSDCGSAPESTQVETPGGSRMADRARRGETPTETFLLSRHYCGSAILGYRRTGDYQGGRLELDDAMAISGAGVQPGANEQPTDRLPDDHFQHAPGPVAAGPGEAGAKGSPVYGAHHPRALPECLVELVAAGAPAPVVFRD